MSSTSHETHNVGVPADFPNAQRLAGRDLFLTILGNPAPSTFARWIAEGKIPKPQKIGSLNRWPETVMAATRDAGFA